jgi:phosphocarrier protein
MGMGFELAEVIDKMKRVKVKIINKNGLHLRLAGEVVKNSSRFMSDIQIEKNTEQINAKSILGVASLGAEYGSELIIIADGEDEDQAISLLVDLFEKGFSEGKK